jgi:hypothetical protein
MRFGNLIYSVLYRIFLLNLYRIQLRNMDVIKTYTLYIDRGEIARSETHTVQIEHCLSKLDLADVTKIVVGEALGNRQTRLMRVHVTVWVCFLCASSSPYLRSVDG